MEIRKIEFSDLSFLNETRNLVSQEYLHDSRTFSLEETQHWYRTTYPEYYIILENNERIGYFRVTNYSQENRNIYIGADIHPNFSGKGFGYSAYKKFIPYIFEKHNLHKISLEVLSTNSRAIHLYKKIGFIEEGTKREEILKNGVYVDSIIMSLLRSELQ